MNEILIKEKKPVGGNAKSHRVKTADRGFITLHPYPKGLALKSMCTECMGFEANPSDCIARACPLYPYRCKTLRTMRGEL
jgi:hypothetical protein